MGLSVSERAGLVEILQKHGWILENDNIWAPSRGLWFTSSHFNKWSLEEFRDIFSARGVRIKRTAHETSERHAAENQEVADAACALIDKRKARPSP